MITQIVPTISPTITGVGDYALNLAIQLRQDFDRQSRFVVCDSTWQGSPILEGFSTHHLRDQTPQNLSHFLSKSANIVLLHYVGYGYAQRGCPFWLIQALESWKKNKPNHHLVTIFHEVYAADRPPWTSAFWLSPFQKNIAARIAKSSNQMMTSKQLYADLLRPWSQRPNLKISTLPVCSNLGEPEHKFALKDRQRRIIIFGGKGHREELYQQEISKLIQVCHLLNIEEIWDLGFVIDCPTHIGDIPVTQKGLLSAKEISHVLSHSLCSFFSYNPDYLAKSGIFAAYCSHGLLPISSQSSSIPGDGIVPNQHYWVPDYQNPSAPDWNQIQDIADQAYCWYQSHNLSVHAKVLFDHLTHF